MSRWNSFQNTFKKNLGEEEWLLQRLWTMQIFLLAARTWMLKFWPIPWRKCCQICYLCMVKSQRLASSIGVREHWCSRSSAELQCFQKKSLGRMLIKTTFSARIGIQRQWNNKCSEDKTLKGTGIHINVFPTVVPLYINKKCLNFLFNSPAMAGWRRDLQEKQDHLCRGIRFLTPQKAPYLLVYWWGEASAQRRWELWQARGFSQNCELISSAD